MSTLCSKEYSNNWQKKKTSWYVKQPFFNVLNYVVSIWMVVSNLYMENYGTGLCVCLFVFSKGTRYPRYPPLVSSNHPLHLFGVTPRQLSRTFSTTYLGSSERRSSEQLRVLSRPKNPAAEKNTAWGFC